MCYYAHIVLSVYIGVYAHMGKTTLYHPVSIYVLRGSLDYGGFSVGRLRQIWSNRETGKAAYAAELVRVPKGFPANTPQRQIENLNKCFSSDIEVVNITTGYNRRTKKGYISVTIETSLHPNSDPHLPGEKQPLLPDGEEPVAKFDNLNWLNDFEGRDLDNAINEQLDTMTLEVDDIPF